jgi:hypothetical protein
MHPQPTARPGDDAVRALVARLVDSLEEAEHKLLPVGADPGRRLPARVRRARRRRGARRGA